MVTWKIAKKNWITMVYFVSKVFNLKLQLLHIFQTILNQVDKAVFLIYPKKIVSLEN